MQLLLAIALLAGQTATAPAPRADLATPAQQRMVHTLWKSGLVERPSGSFGGWRPQTNYQAVMWGYIVSEKLRDPKEAQKAKLPLEFLAEVVHTLYVQLDAELRAIGGTLSSSELRSSL